MRAVMLSIVMALTACTHPPKVGNNSPDACWIFCVINHVTQESNK